MENTLRGVIDEMYHVFAGYHRNDAISGCPCCVSGDDQQKLHRAPLRELEEEDLSRYAFKAMTTWGDVSDFKHYLPRIFELIATEGFIVDTFVILGKLEYGKWETWPAQEQSVIKRLLLLWWSDHLRKSKAFDPEIFFEIHLRLRNIQALLKEWSSAIEDGNFDVLVDFIKIHLYQLPGAKGRFNELTADDLECFRLWLEAQKIKLEQGFFVNIQDKSLSAELSTALYILERIG